MPLLNDTAEQTGFRLQAWQSQFLHDFRWQDGSVSCKPAKVANYNSFLLWFCIFGRSRDSGVSIATVRGLDDRGVGVRVPVGSRIFSSPRRPDRLWGPPNLLSNGCGGSFPGGEADHSPLLPMSRKCGSIHPLPHTPSCRSALLVKHRENFTLPIKQKTAQSTQNWKTRYFSLHSSHGLERT
jgi:hypothetical protein